MPEVQARRRLGARVAALSVLAPVGAFAGTGHLRVLRVAPVEAAASNGAVELVCGYDSYEPMGSNR